MGNNCIHEIWDKETACADGMCPICLAAENTKLREALERYGQHEDHCNIVMGWPKDYRPPLECDCGLGKALTETTNE